MLASGEKKNTILTELKAKLMEIPDFSKSTWKGYRAKIEVPKSLLIHLFTDEPVDLTGKERMHVLTFNIVVQKVADVRSDAEEEMESFISLVGKVEDKLEENYYNPGCWDQSQVQLINYTFSQERGVVFYKALVRFRVMQQW